MSDEDSEDEASIAFAVQYFMTSSASAREGGDPWEVVALDIGEVEITTFAGKRFRLTVDEIEDDE